MKFVYPVALIVVALVLGIAAYLRTDSTEIGNVPDLSETHDTTATTSSSGGNPSYTTAEVAVHATLKSCWAIINGSVYDLTSWIGRHPGGSAAILSLCGKDGSAAFNAQHGGQPNPMAALATFKIGELRL